MSNALIPCPSCRRHVRASDGDCRFCAAALPSDASAVPAARGRLPRAAVFAFATLAVAGCGGSTETETTDAAADTGAGGTLYGGAPADTGVAKDTGPADDGGGGALYGAPADTGVVDTGAADTGPSDDGGSASLYGAPADAGK